jgi:hypothetical protein
MCSKVVFSSSRDEVRRSDVTSGGISFKMDRTCLWRERGGGEKEREGGRERVKNY